MVIYFKHSQNIKTESLKLASRVTVVVLYVN